MQFRVAAPVNFLAFTDASCAQFPNWGRRFDYTAVEVKTDVIQRYLEDKAPEPLLLTKCAEMMKSEDLRVNNMLYMVHYPKQPFAFHRHENAEHICRIEGKPCTP